MTKDNGRHWRSSRIGGNLWDDQFTYSGPDTAVLAACEGHDTEILASRDEGKSWSRTIIPPLSHTPDVACEAAVDGFAFPAGKPCFALVQRHSFPLTKADGYASIWRTGDGGEHWTRVFFERHPTEGLNVPWFNGPYVLGDLTLAFIKTERGGLRPLLARRWRDLASCPAADITFRLLHGATTTDLRGRLKTLPPCDFDCSA